ncbi:hypothetical protein Tco_0356954 [Tanacetum coccineum]
MGGIFSLEARDMDMKLLSAPESNNTLARWFRRSIPVITFRFVVVVLGQMTHLVANITLNNARSYVMQSAFLTQGVCFRYLIINLLGLVMDSLEFEVGVKLISTKIKELFFSFKVPKSAYLHLAAHELFVVHCLAIGVFIVVCGIILFAMFGLLHPELLQNCQQVVSSMMHESWHGASDFESFGMDL